MARTTAISLALIGLLLAVPVFAEPAATVTHLAGVLASGGDGKERRVLNVGSKVESGAILVTAPKTYARLKFADGGEITLKPESEFRIDNFSYDAQKPEKDSALFSLLKGGLRTITGLIGKRERVSYRMSTVIATIGIRGTMYDLQLCEGSSCGQAPAGFYAGVADGGIVLTSASGAALDVGAGQYAYVSAPEAPPVLLPVPPPLPAYDPPVSVLSPVARTGEADLQGGGGLDCQVR